MLRRAAEPILSGLAGFALGAVEVLVFAGDDLPVPPPPASIELAVAVGLLVGFAFVVLALVPGRRNRAERELVADAVRTGRLPDMDDVVLHRVLWERSVRLRSWRWSWLAIGGIQLVLALTHLLSGTDSVYSRVFWGLDLALWIGIVVTYTARARWERPKVERLLDRLDERMAQRAEA
jgi:hypothetical protein